MTPVRGGAKTEQGAALITLTPGYGLVVACCGNWSWSFFLSL